jgi:IclR family pca regulon transcriptional regulator
VRANIRPRARSPKPTGRSKAVQAPETPTRGRYYIEALGRGLTLLDCFVDGPAQLTLAELSGRVGLSKGTTFRLLRTLEEAGYVRQEAQTKRYLLSLKMLDLQEASLAALEYPVLAEPYLEELNQVLGESVSMAVLEGTRIRYVARVASKSLISVYLHVGSVLPAHATSMGKVLLAALGEHAVRTLYGGKALQAYTRQTITSLERLRKELAVVTRQGFAITDGELELGLRSVAAPVFSSKGHVVAAINASASTGRVSKEKLLSAFVPPLLRTAAAISTRLGFRDPRLLSTVPALRVARG